MNDEDRSKPSLPFRGEDGWRAGALPTVLLVVLLPVSMENRKGMLISILAAGRAALLLLLRLLLLLLRLLLLLLRACPPRRGERRVPWDLG